MALSTEDKSSKLFKHYLGTAETKTSRDFYEEAIKSSFSVKPQDIWTYADEIPTDDALCETLLKLKDGECYTWQKDENTFIDIVKKYENYKLSPVDNGTDNSFKILDENNNPIKNIIPFNYYKHYYNYSLYTENGDQIYFGMGDWVVDFYSGVLTFYGQVPEGIDHKHPPLLTFYQYVGGNGFRIDPIGFEAAILPITNWKISKGSCLIDNVNDDGETLIDAIKRQANKVEENFAASYKFDGNDKNEGIALSFEKVIALLYTHNKDAVKGYDESAESDIGTVLSNKKSNVNEIIFVSQNTPVIEYTLSADILIEQDKPTKIYLDKEKKYFIIYKGPALEQDLTFTVQEDTEKVNGLLLYWDRTLQDYLPFVTNEENRYNFGFPVVTSTGKIPPSVALGSISLGQYDDSITPEYYGPRNYTVTIGVENGLDVKSADYIVRNKPGYYLNDIIDNIKKDYSFIEKTIHYDEIYIDGSFSLNKPFYTIDENGKFVEHTLDNSYTYSLDFKINGVTNGKVKGSLTATITSDTKPSFSGSIFLRSGTYLIDKDLDLSIFDKTAFVGETQSSTIIKAVNGSNAKKVVLKADKKSVTFENLDFDNLDFDITGEDNRILFKEIKANNLTCLNNGTTKQLLVNYSSFANVELKSELENVENVNTNTSFILNNNNIAKLTVDTYNSIFSSNNHIAELTYIVEKPFNQVVATDIFTNCIINIVESNIPESVQLRDCFILNDKRTDKKSSPFDNALLLEKGSNVRQYVKLDDPFYVDEDDKDGYNKIKLRIDSGTLEITEDGTLRCILEADDITVNTGLLERWENYEGGNPKKNDLQTVLQNIYKTKADLNPNGKVPLEQLPDSISYGGLSYQGTWSFEESKGKYPTFEDTNQSGDDNAFDDGFGIEHKTIKPGWFWIVASSTKEKDNPAAPQTAIKQEGEENPLIYTAGDWVICRARKDYITFVKDTNAAKITLHDRSTKAIEITLWDRDDDKADGTVYFANSTTTVGGLLVNNGPVKVYNNTIVSLDSKYNPSMPFDFTELKFKGAAENNENLVFYSKDGQLLRCTLGDTENIGIGSEYEWEKLDRAYHDVAYMVLPQLTTGEHVEWSWQKEDETGNNDGKGALALGGQTIAESFDLINQELYKLYPPRSANINDVNLLLANEVPTIVYCDENKHPHTGYDLSQHNDYVSIKSDKGFYYGNSADIKLYVSKDENNISILRAEGYTEDTTIKDKENDITLNLSTTDPYEGGAGAGIWKEAALECNFKPSIQDGINTSYILLAGIEKITPSTQGIYNKESKPIKLNFVKPVMPEGIIVKNIQNKEIKKNKIDGVDYINNDFKLELIKFEIYLQNKTDKVSSKHFRRNGIVEISNPGFETRVLDIDNFDIHINSDNTIILQLKTGLSIDVDVSKYQENFTLKFTYVDIYGERYDYDITIDNNIIENIHIDEKRRSSGDTSTIFPEYSNNNISNENTYGYTYTYTDNELILAGDGYGEERKLLYKANTLNNGYYGALTFEFGDVKEINGFVLDIISPDDLTVNKYSNVTEQFDLYAQILETTQSDNPTASQWINCNSPYDGFSIPGNFADNDKIAFSGMYAGSSNSHKKRVTFGTKTLSGKLFVRLLLKENIRIQDIQLVEVI